MIDNFIKYFEKARLKQSQLYQNGNVTNEDIEDDLINNVPIYDVVNRRFAAFSSFPEALWRKDQDPKGNGLRFRANTIPRDHHFATLLYLLRLCGSGINYKEDHGFGNFWVVKCVERGMYRRDSWIDELPDKGFCDVKGYMLPLIKGGLRSFIVDHSFSLVDSIWRWLDDGGEPREIFEVVEYGNTLLQTIGLNRQNFVLCAFAMDLAEYFPHLVRRDSRVLVGSNAKKCLKMIFPDMKGVGSNLDVTNDALEYLVNITGRVNQKYDMEDVACDFIRYIENYQSPDHIKSNNGIIYTNSICLNQIK